MIVPNDGAILGSNSYFQKGKTRRNRKHFSRWNLLGRLNQYLAHFVSTVTSCFTKGKSWLALPKNNTHVDRI